MRGQWRQHDPFDLQSEGDEPRNDLKQGLIEEHRVRRR